MRKGKWIYFTNLELESMKDFWDFFGRITSDSDHNDYDYWSYRLGSLLYKISGPKKDRSSLRNFFMRKMR